MIFLILYFIGTFVTTETTNHLYNDGSTEINLQDDTSSLFPINAFIGINDPFSVRFTSNKVKELNPRLWKNIEQNSLDSSVSVSSSPQSWYELINLLPADAKSFTFETPEIRKTSSYGGISNWLYPKPPGTRRIFINQVSPLPGFHWSVIIEDKEIHFSCHNRSTPSEYNSITISSRLHRLKYKFIAERKKQDKRYTMDKMASFYVTKYMIPYCDTTLTDDEIWARLEKPITDAISFKYRMFCSKRNCLGFDKNLIYSICDSDKIFRLAKLSDRISNSFFIKPLDKLDSLIFGKIDEDKENMPKKKKNIFKTAYMTLKKLLQRGVNGIKSLFS